MVENWEQYKDLEYYPDRVCACGCGGKIKVLSSHKWDGIPDYICGHNTRVHNPMADPEVAKKNHISQRGQKRDNITGENNPNWQGGKIDILCGFCSKVFQVDPYRGKVAKYCSIECSIKDREINKGGVCLGNNPNWQGGISFEKYPHDFSISLKEHVRIRDNRICQLCGKTEEENRKKLDIHHIDYNKINLDLSNLISLCMSCHRKTNYKRTYWQNYFILNWLLVG